MSMDERHIIVEDETLAAGFTQIPNGVLRRPDIQPGAKLTYMVLLSYAWQKDHAYPGQDRLASDMGVSERSVITYLKQLQESGLITIKRRGLGKTNVYILHRISGSENLAGQGSAKSAAPELQEAAILEAQDLRRKKTHLIDSSEEDLSNDSKGPTLMISREEREQLTWFAADLSREFGDRAPKQSTATRLTNLYVNSDLDLEDFLDALQQARLRTKRYTGNIRTGEDGKKQKLPYFFTVLERLVEAS